jgi:PhzF family phenazine biosynthesis protein
LKDDEMLALARRFGLDTVFILSSQRGDVRLRYFVPDHEMGISGHATIAALVVQSTLGLLKAGSIIVETATGLFRAELAVNDGRCGVTLEQNRADFGVVLGGDAVAEVLRIDISSIDTTSPIQSVSVSRPKLVVPLTSVAVLDSLSPDFEGLWALCEQLHVSGLYPFARTPGSGAAVVQARQFPLRAGFPEDAATGVAAAALAAFMARYDLGFASGTHTFRIGQGCAMGRPSVIETIVECAAGEITRVALKGSAQIVGREAIAI